MPTYDYECSKCRKTFEAFQSMNDSVFSICPKEKCQQKKWGKGKVQRMVGTGAGLIFKGSGFYITDYRSEGYKASAKSESGGGSEGKGTETKPAAAESGGGGSSSKGAEGTPAPASKKPEPKAPASGSAKSSKQTN